MSLRDEIKQEILEKCLAGVVPVMRTKTSQGYQQTFTLLSDYGPEEAADAILALISAHLASDEAVERAVHKSRVIGILPGRSDAEVMRLTNESVLLGNIADLHLETIKEIIRLQAIADNWQTMKDERDAIRDGYQYLLEDTNIEIAALREEIRHLEKKKNKYNRTTSI